MTVLKKALIYLMIITAATSCTHPVSDGTDFDIRQLEYYRSIRSKFAPSFTEHFPDRLSTEGDMACSEDTRGQHVGIIRIDYHVGAPDVSSGKISKADLSCIIPFETISTLTELPRGCDYLVTPVIEQSARFKGFDDGFLYYSVKQTNLSEIPEYHMNPNSTPVESLKHGYSKGVAYNKTSRTAVYWAIVW